MLLLLLQKKKFTINAKTIDGHLKRRISQKCSVAKMVFSTFSFTPDFY